MSECTPADMNEIKNNKIIIIITVENAAAPLEDNHKITKATRMTRPIVNE
jgi:hypothetical protein